MQSIIKKYVDVTHRLLLLHSVQEVEEGGGEPSLGLHVSPQARPHGAAARPVATDKWVKKEALENYFFRQNKHIDFKCIVSMEIMSYNH